MKTRLTGYTLLGALGCAGFSGASLADNDAMAGGGQVYSTLEEIVVTSQKRRESLQDVPVSVTALSGEELVARQIRTAEDLVMGVPNLQVISPLGEGMPVFSLRGISMSDYSLNQNSPIAVYYDEVYKGNWAIQGIGMFDLERVEVLKGPQGTLYGRNTTGGAVNLISRKPSGEPGGYLSLGYGNYEHYMADGAYEAVLTDNLGVRVAFAYDRADGHMKTRDPGRPDLNDTNQYGVRGTVRYQPSDAVDVIVGAFISGQKPEGRSISAVPGPVGVGGPVYNEFGLPGDFRDNLRRREFSSQLDTYREFRNHAVFAKADFQLNEALTLTSITSWDKGKIDFNEDSDGTALITGDAYYFGETRQVSQDLRLTSDNAGPFNFIVGAYYSREDLENRTDLLFVGDLDLNADGAVDAQDCLDNFFIACGFGNSFDQEKTSYALYTDLTYQLTDTLILRGGLRYTHDKGKLTDFSAHLKAPDGTPLLNIIPANYDFPLDATTGRDFRDDNLSGKVGIDYAWAQDVMVYASYSKGYRAAAFNAQAFFAPEELNVADPEEVDAFELGFKSELLGRRLRLNGAAFLYRYDNQQVLDVNPLTAAQLLVNLPESEIVGAELDMKFQLAGNLVLSAGLGYLDTEIKKGSSNGVDVSGNKLQAAPTWSFSGAIDWSVDFAGWSADARLDVAYRSEYHYDLPNSVAATEEGYTVLNSQIRFYPVDDAYGVTLWVKNLTDTFYSPAKYDVLPSFGYIYRQVNAPRTYGVSVDFRF